MSPSKTSPATLARGRGHEHLFFEPVVVIFLAMPAMEFKRQCVHCDCWFDVRQHDTSCADCLRDDQNSNQLQK